MDIDLIRWPDDADRRAELVRTGRARLLLVEQHDHPPPPLDCLEDWVRVPAPEADVAARVVGLQQRCVAHGSGAPTIDSMGIVRHRGAWVALSPVEARLAALLVARPGAVVGRDALAKAAWPGEIPDRNVLDVHVLRLRRRFHVVGLAIRTVRARGYVLEALAAD